MAAVGASATLATPALAQGNQQFRMVTSWPRGFPGHGTAAQQIADNVKLASGGRLQIDVFGAGNLVGAFDVFDAVSDGRDVELTTMEFELLKALLASRGRVLSRSQLIEKLRGIDADIYDRSIDMLVSRLREKLGDDPRRPRFIRTVRLGGYQFIGAISA